jgi:hypothetical protein
MTKEITIGLFNYQSGGRTPDGSYEFSGLQRAFGTVERAPDLVLVNEAKGWKVDGNVALYMAVNALSVALERPYVGEIGCKIRGEATTPALIYDPTQLRLDFWGGESTTDKDRENTALMHVMGRQASKFRVAIRHFDPDDGSLRLAEAHQTKGLVKGLPTLLGGDLNNAASGPHVDMDWTKATERLRQTKAKLLSNGTYAVDTDVMDLMLGDWDPATQSRTNHALALARAAIGWHALAELAYHSGTPLEEAMKPTVNRSPEEGGGLLIDWLLVNNAWKEGLVANTYQVHEPVASAPEDYPSDHRLVTATLEI